ncbi:NYN domain-containing protein [Gordonia shandongensis]|uniref:NYN domain-containing protein n=1 Tax=Gordonia shandongensis TaxID=376351 RepID=UPI00041032E9|nr:NYN domain-containing protein [Gordonia shandongensis]
MRATCSLYIDTGYLLASAATRVTGTSLRSSINVHYPGLIDTLVTTAETLSGLPVLRAHWYDSARNGVPDAQQERIGELAKVKLRLGRFGVNGEQKGVDLRIGLDLVTHARNRISDVFFLVSGDDDLTEAVEEAQAHGVQVVVLSVPAADGRPHGVNRHLLRAADDLHPIDGPALDESVLKVDRRPLPGPAVPDPPAPVTAKPGPRRTGQAAPRTPLDLAQSRPSPADRPASPRTAATPSGVLAYSSTTGSVSHVMPEYDDVADEAIEDIVGRVLVAFQETADPEQIAELEGARPSIPRDIDRALLLDASEALDRYTVDEDVRFRLRASFWEQYDRA